MSKRVIGLDCEVADPLLKTSGWSWKYGQGYILNTALYYKDTDKVAVIAGIHNANSPYSENERLLMNKMSIESILKNPDVCIVGANLQYDIGWLLYEYKMSTYDVKCSFVDVLQAESILDEFNIHSLEEVSWKYLNYGKTKDRIEEWVMQNVPKAKGDFRKYLDKVPYDLLCEYVEGDAKNPVKVWQRQLPLLQKQNLCSRCKLEFDCILPTLQMTMNGMPFDNEMRKKNCKELIAIRDELKKEFEEKYSFKNFNVNSSRSIAELCDKLDIPYKCKITLKGYNGEKFKDYKDTDSACVRAKRLVSSFRYVKSVPVAYVPSNIAERTCALLEEEGFMFTCSPNVDKKFFASQRNNYEVIATIADWKLANGIISKILGDAYERFLCPDGKVRPQFKITDTVSFRYSSNSPNFQQLPSKNGLKVGDKEFSFPGKIRTLCYAPKGHIFGKIDYGQIEYRLICNIACGKEGEEVRKQYAENPKMDFHQYVVDLTGLSRKYAKNMSFGCFERNSYYLSNKGWRKVRNTIDSGILDLEGKEQFASYSFFKDKGLKFTLSNGVQFIVNKEHEFLDCERAEKEFFTKKAIEMKVGDRFPLTLLHHKGESDLTVSQAYLAGLYVGDGCGCQSSLGLISHKENKDKVEQCLKDCNFSYSFKEESKVVRFIVHKEAKDFFHAFGNKTSNKHLTEELYTSTEEVQLAFLAGLIDSDGSIKDRDFRFMGTNEKLLREVALLCAMLGFDCYFNVCKRNNKPTEYNLLVYSTNGHCIPSVYRSLVNWKGSKTDVRGWKLERSDTILKRERSNIKLYKENPKLYEYLIRTERNCFVHNSFIPTDCWQKDFLPVEIIKIEEVKEAEFVCLSTTSNYYNAMGIATHNCSFGMGLPSMAETFGWTMEKAEEISEQYHHHMPFVKPTLALVGDVAKERGYIKTVCGSHARLPNPNKAYTMLNRYTQGSGAECLKTSIVKAYKEGIWERLKVSNTVHDELGMPYVPVTEQGVLDLYRMAEIMRTVIPTLRVPLEASPEIGSDWYNVKELPKWIKCRDNNDDDWKNTTQDVRDFVTIAEKLYKEGKISV